MRALERIEDRVEADIEFVRIVVARLHRLLADELDEVRVVVGENGASIPCATSATSAVDSNGKFIFVNAKP